MRKEIQNDLDAIQALMSACQKASLDLTNHRHVGEMQTELKKRIVILKAHQEKVEEMVFAGKQHACGNNCTHIYLYV